MAHTPSSNAAIHALAIKDVFETLDQREKLYAHHFSNASWHGSKIIMRQVSEESPDIFAFIMEVHRACNGKWSELLARYEVSSAELSDFLEFSASFLCNLGNYYGEGDQKFIPNLSETALQKFASVSPVAEATLKKIIKPLLAVPPFSLGFPSDIAQSNYYPGTAAITRNEIAQVSKAMEKHSIEPENTRVRKIVDGNKITFEVLQASAEKSPIQLQGGGNELSPGVHIVRGDHSAALSKICIELEETKKHAANDKQVELLSHAIESFRTGSMESYRESQKVWVTDASPKIENMIGFVESYRDPQGIRSEFEGVVSILDPDETKRLTQFVDQSSTFLRLLPWAVSSENEGKGPFEKNVFVAPDFISSHALTVCYSMVFEASNIPNYNDIRENYGFKNVVFPNRMDANHNPASPCHYVLPADEKLYRKCTHVSRFVTTAIHELIGHGTGKLLSETSAGQYNFNKEHPPISPLTKEPIKSWYLPGQTWTSVFEDIATSVEECRATLVSEYLVDNRDLLSIFGYNDSSDITADDLIYITYIDIGVQGIRALEFYNVNNHAWGEAHKQGHYAIFKYLLKEGDGTLRIEHNVETSELKIHVDRSRILTHGKAALGRFLCRLHIWRCTADSKPCRELYEDMTAVDGVSEEWRKIVCSKPDPRWKFVQANTFLKEGAVEIKEYEPTNEGIIESWAERNAYLGLSET